MSKRVVVDEVNMGEMRQIIAREFEKVLGNLIDETNRLHRALQRTGGVMTKHELARELNVKPHTVMQNYVKKLGLPVYRPGKAPLFLWEDVRAWLKEYEEPVSG